MRLDRSELLCNKVLLKYKGDRESFWHRHQKGAERVPPCWSSAECYIVTAAAAAKSRQLCPTLCNPIDGSPPGSPVPGILQARTLEWVAISFSNAWKWKVKEKSLSHVRLLATPWTAAYQAPPSMGFSRQEYWSGAPKSVNKRKECLKTQTGTRPLINKMHFGIILAPNGLSWAIKWLTWILKKGRPPYK